MRRCHYAFPLLIVGALGSAGFTGPLRADDARTEALLKKNTQDLMNAISEGKPAVWDRLMEPGASYTDESGAVLNKKTMVDSAKGMPAGISGTIRVIEFHTIVRGDLAVTMYVSDEDENYHGHKLHCQYRSTDTWRETKVGWRLVAGQVLALRTDPPAMPTDADDLEEYCGRYALTPEIAYEIRCTDHGLEGQQTGRKTEAIKREAPDVFFVPGKPRYRKIFLRDADGEITGFAERREAWDIVWTREDAP